MEPWQLKVLSERFELLRQLANIFMVRPAILLSIMREELLATLDFAAMKPFLMMREDWVSSKIEKELRDAEEEEMAAAKAGTTDF